MGIYLSTPSTSINIENGNDHNLQFSVGEMQGWRRNMEDSHIAITNLNNNNSVVSLFGVFDGHGGKEVAKFVKLKYPTIIKDLLLEYDTVDIGTVLRESFHKVDDMLEDEQYNDLLQELRNLPNPSDIEKEQKLREEEEAEEAENSNNNKAEDENATSNSFKDAVDVLDEEINQLLSIDDDHNHSPTITDKKIFKAATNNNNNDNIEIKEKLSTNEAVELIRNVLHNAENKKTTNSDGKKLIQELSESENSSEGDFGADADNDDNKNAINPRRFEAVSTRYVGGIDMAAISPEILEDNTSTNKASDDSVIGNKTSKAAPTDTKFAMDLAIRNPEVTTYANIVQRFNVTDRPPPQPASIRTGTGMSCNLKGHRILAGCTAVVVMIIDNKLYCANAGDSRGVLCRKEGEAFALSYDHKPSQERESKRISSAGGFVNLVGRVNGNLNLSRSLGDLKYKQLYHLSREEQIITAEPDITITELEPTDRFFILACDGVWDSLTNQQACDFVNERLDKGMSCEEITKEILHHCLADDPRRSSGVGGDNMTFLLVLLNNYKGQ